MRFWSEGLGDRQLVMNLSKAKIKRTDEIIMLNGVVDSPAPWEYEVKINQNDWVKILETAVTPEACGFIAKQATLLQLVTMAWSIIVFIVLLTWYRIRHLLHIENPHAAVNETTAQPSVHSKVK